MFIWAPISHSHRGAGSMGAAGATTNLANLNYDLTGKAPKLEFFYNDKSRERATTYTSGMHPISNYEACNLGYFKQQ